MEWDEGREINGFLWCVIVGFWERDLSINRKLNPNILYIQIITSFTINPSNQFDPHKQHQSRRYRYTSSIHRLSLQIQSQPPIIKMHSIIKAASLFLLLTTATATPVQLLQTRDQGSCALIPCAPSLCCSQYKYYGTGPEYCQAGSCAGVVGGTYAPGLCCSEWGFCGTGAGFCRFWDFFPVCFVIGYG